MHTDDSLTYTWDALNRLVQVEESGAAIATYGYNAQNRRIRKTAGGRTIHYHYDMFNQLIAETLAMVLRSGITYTSTANALPSCGIRGSDLVRNQGVRS